MRMENLGDSCSSSHQSEDHIFRGFLLDVDGTIIDTTSAIIKHWKNLIPTQYGAEVREIPGARRLLEALGAEKAPWALVTSCTRNLLGGWLRLLDLPTPPISVAAEDVIDGKPDPACYSLARERCDLGEQPGVLVIEDAPAGIRAGKAAGCEVLALATTHDVERLRVAGADWIVKDLNSVRILGKKDDGWRVILDTE
ncbi:MAG: hypothetical protein Q9226_001634 [Calogaya cf. arnoldii]